MADGVKAARERVLAVVDAMLEGRVSRDRPYRQLEAALAALEAAVRSGQAGKRAGGQAGAGRNAETVRS